MSAAAGRSSPWLTVIMPSHRGERWIDTALRTLAAEAATGMEILILDSSPTSATVDIARQYAESLDVRIFDRPDLASWPAKTNVGVSLARAEHICWLHVDDVWFSGRTATVRSWIDQHPNIPLHLAPSAIIDSRGRTLGVWRCPLPAETALPSAMVVERLLVQNFIAAPAPVFRKDAWLACGGLDESLWYTADWDLWLKLAESGPVCYHECVTTGFRIHSGSLTVAGSGDLADFAIQMHTVLDRHLPRQGGNGTGVERAARASIGVNCALAAAAAGDFSELPRALFAVLRLGPSGLRRYWRDSRIADRVLPRLSARLRGAL